MQQKSSCQARLGGIILINNQFDRLFDNKEAQA
jgi:hypothetical protein